MRYLARHSASITPGGRVQRLSRQGFLALSLLAGCITEQRVNPEGTHSVIYWQTEPDSAWLVRGPDGGPAGYVVRFAARSDQEVHYFSVRNLEHQELGTLDALGRAYRFAPHAREAAFLGAGTATEGAARILGLAPETRLEAVPLEGLGTRAPR